MHALFEPTNAITARWVHCDDNDVLEDFCHKNAHQLARDAADALVYLATSLINLQMTQERWPRIRFAATRDQSLIEAAIHA